MTVPTACILSAIGPSAVPTLTVRMPCLFGPKRERLGLVLRAWCLGRHLVELKLVITYGRYSYHNTAEGPIAGEMRAVGPCRPS